MNPKNIEDIYPLSSTQQGMLFHCLSAPESRVYLGQLALTIEGRLNVEAFEKAWRETAHRHAVLRTLFVWDRGDKPLQIVLRQVTVPFAIYDRRLQSQLEAPEFLDSFLEADRRRGFVLSEAPLMRISFIKAAEDLYYFLWSHHHLILDGWSVPIVLKEVFGLYEAFCRSETLRLQPSRPFHEYITWLKQQDILSAEAFWREQLRGFTATTRLDFAIQPDKAPEPNDNEDHYAQREISLSARETRRVRLFAQSNQLTPSTLIRGAWALLLGRYSRGEDVVFGVTLSGRSAGPADVGAMVGMFINTLPARIRIPAGTLALPWLKRIQQQQLEIQQYEYCPLSQVSSWSDIPHGESLFESILVFENYPIEDGLLDRNKGLKVSVLRSWERTNYPLTVAAANANDSLSLQIGYDRRQFDESAITRMLGHMQVLLEAIISDPEQSLSNLSLLSRQEQHQCLVLWNETQAEYSRERLAHELFERQATCNPERVALPFTDEQITYGDLNARANQLAHYLQGMGVGTETVVGLCVERSIQMVVGLLGILKAGGVYLPLAHSHPAERLGFMLEDAAASVLLTTSYAQRSLPPTRIPVLRLDRDWDGVVAEPETAPIAGVTSGNTAYVIYTSGSTGNPKGVMITHEALCNHLFWMQKAFPLTGDDCLPQKYSLSFDVSVLEILYPLTAGARLEIARPGAYDDYLIDLITERRITAIDTVPSMLRVLLSDDRFRECRSLKRVICGGEALPFDLQESFFQSLSAELHNLYGPTETTISSTFHTCRNSIGSGSDRAPLEGRRIVPIGRPIANTQIYILDHQTLPAPVCVPGEICIAGAGLARGYLNQAALTAEKFIPDPFNPEPGRRFYRTGDLGRYSSGGAIEYLGREDDQVKIRGFRIELGEIETALTGHAGVREAIVLARENRPGVKRLEAYVVVDREDALSVEELTRFVEKKLPEYMVPATIVMRTELPLTLNGKVDRAALLSLSANKQAFTTEGEIFVAPRTNTEKILAEIWAKVFGLERVSVLDNFFALGGDSILSLQIVARANNAGLPLTPRHIFEHRTIAELATVMGKMFPSRAEQGSVSGPVPLTPIQCWFFEQDMAQRHHYNQAVMLEAKCPLDPDLLRQSFRHLVSHHDALRLRFTQAQSGWEQFNAPESGADEPNDFFSLEWDRLQSVRSTNGDGQTEVCPTIQAGLSLERGPLLRAALLRGADGRPDRLLIAIHHLAVDAVSWQVLLEDLQAAYRQLSRREQIEAPPKTASFKRWAEALREHVERERQELEREAAYWLSPSRREVGRIPADARGENLEGDARSLAVWLSEERTRELFREAQAAYRTEVNELLLAALAEALWEWSGESRLLVDLEGHGREEIVADVNVARTVGWFTTIYPVLLEASAGRDAGSVIKSVKEQLRGVPNKGINYGVLRYLCGRKEEMEEAPQAEVSFNYLGRLEQGLGEVEMFRLSTETCGRLRGERNERRYLLDVEASVTGGGLKVEWEYNERFHRRETIERLAGSYIEALERLIDHCLNQKAGGFTPSDFPLVRLEQKQIDNLIGEYGQIEDVYALSPMQQGLLFHTLYESAPGIYIEQVSCSVRGGLNLDLLEQAWRQAIDRHAILRTGFRWEGFDEPVQVVLKSAQFSIERYDWSDAPSADYAQRLDAFLKDDRELVFDLEKAPLMRLAVIRVGHNDYKFIWTSHHLLLDGWSMSLLFKEVFGRYDALYRGPQSQFEPPRPYRDYIAWLKRRKLQDRQNAETFWRLMLKGFSSDCGLRIADCGFNEEVLLKSAIRNPQSAIELSLPISLTIALQEAAKKHQLTLNTFVQGAWALLLSRYSGEDDLVFGSVVSGRPPDLKGVETMIGLFINTLPVRARIPLHTSSRSWLEELQDLQAKSRQFEYVSLLQIQEWSEIPRPRPLFESVVVFENYPVAESLEERFEGFAVSDIQLEERASYPLALTAVPGAKLQLRIAYDSRRFDACSVVRMSGHLQTLLEQMADHPDRSIIDLRLLTEIELEQILFHWNGTSSSNPPDLLVHQQFEEQAERTPDATAVVFEGEQLTYGELNRRANQLAHYLCRLGVGPETPVGVLMERSIEMIVSLLGVHKAGGIYAPLDPSYPPERLSFMIEDAQVYVLLTQRDGLQSVRSERMVFIDADWGEIAAESAETTSGLIDIDNAAYIIYTSGSTGKPKSVIVVHLTLINLIRWQLNHPLFSTPQRTLQFSSLSFDVSLQEIFATLCAGGTLVLIDEETHRDPTKLWATLRECAVERLFLPFVALQQLAEAAEIDESAKVSLRRIITAGEALKLTPAIKKMLNRMTGCILENQYGPTESHVATSYSLPQSIAQWVKNLPPIGRPIANTEIYILDSRTSPAPVGVVGDLYIGGAPLARGYLNQPAQTGERFLPAPFGERAGARLYLTGDRARYLPDGNIEFLGRRDHQVKIRGYRIELGEIEVTLGAAPEVRECAAAVRMDDSGNGYLIGYLVCREGEEVAASELRSFLRQRLPDYMVPSAFVYLESLPLTPSGKVDRRALPAPESKAANEGTYVAPRTPVEEIVVGIFEETLMIHGVGRVGVHDNFFEIGGHSLFAMQVASRVRSTFNIEIGVRSVFEAATVESLARRLEAAMRVGEKAEAPPLVRVSREDQRGLRLPLSPAQQRLWFLDRLEPGSDVYNIPVAVLLEGRLNIAALSNCFNEIVRRHEVLRTTFENAGDEPIQVINSADIFSVSVIDLSDLDEERREAETERLIRDEARRPFDLTRGPLLWVTILRLEEERHVLSVTMHHIVSDGWSMKILSRETTNLYQAFIVGKPSPLPDPPIQYADYAIWQREALAGGFLSSQLDYWKGCLHGAPARLTLPQDKPRPKVQTYNGATRSLHLSEELSDALMALSRREGVTLFMTLLSGFTALLSRYTNQDDIVVGAPVANRTVIETESLIGFFVNTLALRTDLSGNPSFEELLRRARETTIDAYTHQDFPVEKLVEELQPERDPSRTPLFQVLFSLDDVRALDWKLPGLTTTALELESATSKFDLSLLVENTGKELQSEIEYNTDLFDEATILRRLGHLENLLRYIVTDPSRRIAEIPLLTGVEEYQLLVQWNETERASNPDALIHELFEEQSARAPDAVALVYDDLHLTYHELNCRANGLAGHLRSMGVGCEILVGLFIHRSVEMIVSLLGILKAGGIYLPLDPEYPLERLKLILDGAEPAVVLTELRLLERLPEERRQRALCVLDRLQSVHDMNWDRQTEVRSTGASATYVMYTSGSTGRPKGVAVTHRGVVRLAHKPNYVALGSEEVFLQLAPVSFDASTFEIWGSLLNGARLVLAPSHQSPQASGISLESLGRIIRETGITTLWLTAGLFRLMVEHKLEDLRHVRQLLAGGDILSVSHVENFLSSAEASALINGYGPTENTTFTCCHAMKGREQFTSSVPIGRPISETQVYVLDGNRRPVPQGVVGELYIGGAGLARGYFGRPDLTAGEFMPNPFSGEPGARMYRSGDLARHLQNGDLEFIGRIDEQVKVRGFRVEPLEVEAAMSEFPGIKESVILAVETADERRLAAYFTIIKDSSLSIKELRSYLRSKLPEYMIPSTFVRLSQLPLTPNGKIDRKALPAHTPENLVSEERIVAPRDIVEEQLARMWSELLGLERVGVYDNFFDLGGHSLLATRLQSRVQEAFQVEIPLHNFFEAGTVAEMARALIAREARPGQTEKIAMLLKKIETMSVDEIKSALLSS